MSKLMLTLLAGLSLSLGLTESAFAKRNSDRVQPGKGTVHQMTWYSETEADTDFDKGHAAGYLCTYDVYKDGKHTEWLVTWYKK